MKYSSELFIKNIEYLVKYGGEPEEAQELSCAFLLVTLLRGNANPSGSEKCECLYASVFL